MCENAGGPASGTATFLWLRFEVSSGVFRLLSGGDGSTMPEGMVKWCNHLFMAWISDNLAGGLARRVTGFPLSRE